MVLLPLVFKFGILSAAVVRTEGLLFDSPYQCNPSASNNYIVGPHCSTGNVTITGRTTVNFYNSHYGYPMKVCFAEINDCSYSFYPSSCDMYTNPPSFLYIRDTTNGIKRDAVESGNERCTYTHSDAGVSVEFEKQFIPNRDVLMRYRIL